jgi:hypothetical protein
MDSGARCRRHRPGRDARGSAADGAVAVSSRNPGRWPGSSPRGRTRRRGRGAGWRSGSARQRRQYGVKTRKWSPAAGVISPAPATVTPGNSPSSIPSSAQAPLRRRSRRRAYALTSALAKTARAPADRATARTSPTVSPWRTTSALPSARNERSRSPRDSRRNCNRFGRAKSLPSSASSSTKRGTMRSATATAFARAGWSWTRRSRVNSTTAVAALRCVDFIALPAGLGRPADALEHPPEHKTV